MSNAAKRAIPLEDVALAHDFPIVEVSRLAERESWRKELSRPLYHIHKWWATRLGSVFRAMLLGALSRERAPIWEMFYEHHDLADKVVLDPFMGSGTTLGEALKLGCKVVGCDINPVSTFAVRQSLTPVSEKHLRAAFKAVESRVAEDIRALYSTTDPATGERIPVLYFFWVKTVSAPNGETIPLFDNYIFSRNAYPKRKPRAQIVCPKCWNVIEGRYDDTETHCARCSTTFNPQDGPASGQRVRDKSGAEHKIRDLLQEGIPPAERMYACLALRPNGEKIYLPITDEDRAAFEEASRRLSSRELPLPTLDVRPGHNTNQARAYGYHKWRDFFNDRQLLALGLLLEAITDLPDTAAREQLLCLFSSSLEFNNRFCSFKGEGTGAVRHMFSHHILKPERTPLENCVWGNGKGSGTFASLFESRLLKAKRYLDDPFELALDEDLLGGESSSRKVTCSAPIRAKIVDDWASLISTPRAALVLNGDSSALQIPDGSVDAVVTDPPYFDFIHYSELSDFFYAWLSPVLKERYRWAEREHCGDAGEVQQKDPRAFGANLGRVLSECSRVLKPNGVVAFTFHHSRAEGWAAIHDALSRAGLFVVAAHPVHGELRAASPKTATRDPISLDAILVCQKAPTHARHTETDSALRRINELAERLSDGGIRLSRADRFVIGASQLLIDLGRDQVDFEHAVERLEAVQRLV